MIILVSEETARMVEEIDLVPIGRRIRMERGRLNISRAELARRAGIQDKTLAQIEKGEQGGFSVRTLIAITKGLGNIDVNYLLFGEARTPPV